VKLCPTCGQQWPDETKFCPNDGSTLKAAGATDLVGSVIADRYHIQKKLGEGGMGAVYLGEHVKMGRKSAIKVMTQSMANDPDAIARFNREAANAARINHPNVCAIYDFGETKDGLIYLAMEYIEGESLSDLLEREGALPPHRAAQIFQQAADALQAAHDLGIVHRDLKPDNIMITKGRGGTDVVKVVDFGIAKAMTGEEGQKVTKTGLVVGTPEYMSPEQLAGDKLDGRSDLYSLALVLYRMLTGTLPFQADSAQEVMIKRLTDEPLPLNQARPGVEFPPQLQAVMDRALQRMPSERYASATDLARDVLRAVSGMAEAAPPVDTEGATQLISALPAGATVAPTRVSREGAPAAPHRAATPDTAAVAVSPPHPVKKKPVAAIAAAVAVVAVGGGAAALLLNRGGAPARQAEGQAASVTQDTAKPTAGGQPTLAGGAPSRSSAPASRTSEPQPRSGVSVPPPAAPPAATGRAGPRVDSAAVEQQLSQLLDRILEPDTRVAARQEATAIYDNADVPANLRATAGWYIAQAYFEEGRRGEACQWLANANGQTRAGESAHAKLRQTFADLRTRWGCP
jgi:serine/threonine-protein kinase